MIIQIIVMIAFYSNFLNAIMNVSLQKNVKACKKFLNKPWFTKELHKMCNKKWFLYKKYLKNPSEYRHKVYKQYRNFVNNELKKAKHLYIKQKIDNAMGDMKRTWNILQDLMGSKKKGNKKISEIKHNGDIIQDKGAMSEIFNDYFVNIDCNLRGKVQSPNNEHRTYLRKNERNAFFVPVTTKKIIDIVCDLKIILALGLMVLIYLLSSEFFILYVSPCAISSILLWTK